MNRGALAGMAVLTLALMACGGQPAVSAPASASPVAGASSASPSAPAFARGIVTFQTKGGPVSLNVEIADDEPKREYGLMNRTSLPADAGMLFVFNPPANAQLVGFWMEDTLIPLTVAFVEPSMRIEAIADMLPLTKQVHYAPRDYAYAIEANQGWFASHGVGLGDTVQAQGLTNLG